MTVLEMGQTLCLFIYDIVGVSAPTNQGARGSNAGRDDLRTEILTLTSSTYPSLSLSSGGTV